MSFLKKDEHEKKHPNVETDDKIVEVKEESVDEQNQISFADKLKQRITDYWEKKSFLGKALILLLTLLVLLFFIAFIFNKTGAMIIAILQLGLLIIAILIKKDIIKVTQKWIYLLLIVISLVLLVPYVGSFKGSYGDAVKIEWSDLVLGENIPEPKSKLCDVLINDQDNLDLYVYKTDLKRYEKYLEKCIIAGYVIEPEEIGTTYEAYHESGFKLSLSYYEYGERMKVSVDAPEIFGALQWPDNSNTDLLPVPVAQNGKIEIDNEHEFKARIGNTFLEEYDNYVNTCIEIGFDKISNMTDETFSAKNDEGYKLSVQYVGNGVMEINLSEPEYSIEIEVQCFANWFFNKYDVEVYLDDLSKGILEHGSDMKCSEILKKGTHTIKCINVENEEVYGELTFDVDKEGSVLIYLECNEDEVELVLYDNTASQKYKEENELSNVTPTSESVQTPEITPSLTPTPEVKNIRVTKSSSDYLGIDYNTVINELRNKGFSDVKVRKSTIDDESVVSGSVIQVTVSGNEFERGKLYAENAEIIVTYISVAVPEIQEPQPEAETEIAFKKEYGSYDVYYIFNTADQTVKTFMTADTYISDGVYIGDFSSGVTIRWDHGQYTETFIYTSGSKNATLIDGTGTELDYKLCNLANAKSALNKIS